MIVIDYTAPGQRQLAHEISHKIRAAGFTPWVSNPELDMIGVGFPVIQPRRILMLYNGNDTKDVLLELNTLQGDVALFLGRELARKRHDPRRRPCLQLSHIAERETEHGGDDRHRKWLGEAADELDLAVGDESVDELVDDAGDELALAVGTAPIEERIDEIAISAM